MTDALLNYLAVSARSCADDQVWRPLRFQLSDPEAGRALEDLRARGAITEVRDELRGQLLNLIETRHPASTLPADELERLVGEKLGGVPEALYGEWVYYPWSRRLVHVLPEPEYKELRTSRNRNKITAQEQEILSGLRIGIVGLSIGQAAALTLTLEGVGGFLALADFDTLELSNMNRLRAGVHGLGVHKAVLAAREVYEINPYADLDLWLEGITKDNVEGFMHAGGQKLDLIYEECDDLQIKLLVREHARKARIPVLMETSDRGLMDIERFDLEPDRPIFHGLIGDVSADDLAQMSTYDKVPVVMQIIGRHGMSDRMAASMVDIESTLKSWPQTASEVSLGAGINIDVARRIALGQLNVSGRFYVDLEKIISDDAVRAIDEPQSYAIEISEEAHRLDLPPLESAMRLERPDAVRNLVAWGTTAFSGGNCQPWQINFSDGRLVCVHDIERSRSLLDAHDLASYLAFGSLAENLDLTARAMGWSPSVALFPDRSDPRRVFDFHLGEANEGRPVDDLVAQLPNRVTNRKLGQREPLRSGHREALMAEVEPSPCTLHLVESDATLDVIARILGVGDRVRLLSEVMHREMMHEVRWDLDEVERTRDGLDVATLEMTPTELAGMRLVSSWSVMKMVGAVGGGLGLERPTRKAIGASSAVGLLTVPEASPRGFFEAGRTLQRLWLRATALGLAFQPMTALTYLFYRLEHMDGEGFTPKEKASLEKLRRSYLDVFPLGAGEGEPMLFRLSYAPPPSARSLRRRVDDVLSLV